MIGSFVAGTITYGPDYVTLPDGTPMPTQVTDAVGAFLTTTAAAMANAAGIVAKVTPVDASAVLVAASALSGLTAPLTTMTEINAGLVYHAAMLGARAMTVANVLNSIAAARWTRRVINPNLPMLAAQYYNDASLWTVIAAANNLSDPQPIGSFQLTIPAQ